MNLNPITTSGEAYTNYTDTSVKSADSQAAAPAAAESKDKEAASSGVIYEPSTQAQTQSTNQIYKRNTALIDQLKADAQDQQNRLMSYVQQMISGQGNALAQSDDVWKFLASGNFTVDAAAKKLAQEAISEDGYWGVEKTSDRILEFAKALSGGDPSKIGDLRDAFEKGFGEATKTWGKELPEISGKTYNAVMEKFKAWEQEYNKTETPTETTPVDKTEQA